jgi:hypothetical protein
MTRRAAGWDEKRSLRVELSAADCDIMDRAAEMFGVGKSELVRRLVRASVDVGPALSAEGVERIEALTGQVRMVGRNLMQVLHAIHRGDAVGIAETEPVWRGLHEMIASLDDELTVWAEASGAASVSLRRRAGLVVRRESATDQISHNAGRAGVANPLGVSRSAKRKSASVIPPAVSSRGLVPSVPAPVMIADGLGAE